MFELVTHCQRELINLIRFVCILSWLLEWIFIQEFLEQYISILVLIICCEIIRHRIKILIKANCGFITILITNNSIYPRYLYKWVCLRNRCDRTYRQAVPLTVSICSEHRSPP